MNALTPEQLRAGAELTGLLIIVLENILPHLPVKANSTVQVIINVAKAILGKKA